MEDPAGSGAPPASSHASRGPGSGSGTWPGTWYAKRLHLRRLLEGRGAELLTARSTLVTAPRGTLLFEPRGTGDEVWWIEEGRLRLSRFAGDGRETVAAVLEEGEILGLEPRQPFAVNDAFAEVIESGEFRRVTRADFEAALDEEEAAPAVARQLAHQWELDAAIVHVDARDPRSPVVRLAELIGALGETRPAGGLPRMALQEFALLATAPRPVCADALSHWLESGALTWGEGRLRVVDAARLRAPGRAD